MFTRFVVTFEGEMHHVEFGSIGSDGVVGGRAGRDGHRSRKGSWRVRVTGTAILGWDASEEQIVDAGFIENVGHRITRLSIETDEVWKGTMRGFLLGGKVETAVRLEKKSPTEFVLVINAAGDMPENEYLFTKIGKARKPKKQ